MSPPPDLASPCIAPATLFCIPHGVAVHGSLCPYAPHTWSSLPPMSPIPPKNLRSRCSIPCSRCLSPPGLPPSCSALPRLHSFSSVHGPAFRAPSPPLSPSLRLSSSPLSPPLRADTLCHTHSSLLLRSFSPLPTLGPYGRSPRPGCPFPPPQPPILPVGINMSSIGREGFCCAGRWLAGPRHTGRILVGPSS